MRELAIEEIDQISGGFFTEAGFDVAGAAFDVAGFPEIGIPLEIAGFFAGGGTAY